MTAGKRILVSVLVLACAAAPPAAAAPAGRGLSAVAHRFASAYLHYIDGRGKAWALPAVTRAVPVEAVEGGKIPPRQRHGRVVLVSLKPVKGVAGGVLIEARIGSSPLFAEAVLTRRGHEWMVTNLLTPDFVQVFAHPVIGKLSALNGAGGPEAAARRFLSGYLRWAYGHGPVGAIHAASGGLIGTLAANPPNIPPTMSDLQGRVRAIAMQRAGPGWQALVNVNDADSTYQLTLTLARFAGGDWRVVNVRTQ